MNDVTGSLDGQLPLHSVGERLRLAREKAGMTLEQVGAETRIPLRHLELIEAGDFSALPARTYATGFARSYAKAVGLDDRAVVDDVRAELGMSDRSDRGRVATFEPGDPARVPSRGLALASFAALILLLIGGTMFYNRVMAPESGPASLLEEEAAVKAAPAPAAAAPTASGPVVFTALEDGLWVKFYDGAGTQLLQKEMAKGETFTIPADAADPKLWTGRPDALAITVGGQPVAKIAESQEIVRDVPVSAAALLARTLPSAAPTTTGAAAAPTTAAANTVTPVRAPAAAPSPAPRRTAAPRPRPRPTATTRPQATATVSNPAVQTLPGQADAKPDAQEL